MFDWLRDIKDQIGERMRSPLYGVFATSWIVSNWRAIYISLFESKKTLGLSKVDFIYYKLYPCCEFFTYGKLFIWPVIATIIYIWALPYLVHLAFVSTEKFKDSRKQEKLKILKASVVKGEIYLDLKKKYDDALKSYANVIEDSSNSVTRIRELEVKNAEAEIESEAKSTRITQLDSIVQSLNSTLEVQEYRLDNLMHGPTDIFPQTWESRYAADNTTGHEIFKIEDGYKYVIVYTGGSGSVLSFKHVFDIDRFVYSRQERKLTFRKVGILPNLGSTLEVTLFEKSPSLWEGVEIPIIIKPDPLNVQSTIETRGEPVNLTISRVVMTDDNKIIRV